MSATKSRLAVLCLAIAVCHVAKADDYPNFTLTEFSVRNWPTAGNGLFTFSIGNQSFSLQMPSYTDVPITPGMEAVLTNGVDDMVRLQLGDNFFERPESFFTGGTDREETIDGVIRWQNTYVPPLNGIDWQGDRFNRFTVDLIQSEGRINTDVILRGGAPEPATWLLAVLGLLGLAVRSWR